MNSRPRRWAESLHGGQLLMLFLPLLLLWCAGAVVSLWGFSDRSSAMYYIGKATDYAEFYSSGEAALTDRELWEKKRREFFSADVATEYVRGRPDRTTPIPAAVASTNYLANWKNDAFKGAFLGWIGLIVVLIVSGVMFWLPWAWLGGRRRKVGAVEKAADLESTYGG